MQRQRYNKNTKTPKQKFKKMRANEKARISNAIVWSALLAFAIDHCIEIYTSTPSQTGAIILGLAWVVLEFAGLWYITDKIINRLTKKQ